MKIVITALKLLIRRIPYIAIFAFSLYGIVYVAQLAYFRYAPPSQFLNVRSATIETSQVNQPLQLTYCRAAKYSYPEDEVTAHRSFFKIEGQSRIAAGDYDFKPNIEKGDKCQVIVIPITKHPSEAGVYNVQTTVRFSVHFDGHRFNKVVEYDLDKTFELRDTVEGLQSQIRTLQAEIESLKAILRSRGVDVPATPTPVTSTTTTPTSATVERQQVAQQPSSQPVAAGSPPDGFTPPALSVQPAPVIQLLPAGGLVCVNTGILPGVCL